MVACIQDLLDVAVDPGDDPVKDRRAAPAGLPAGRPYLSPPRAAKRPADVLLVVGQHIDAERPAARIFGKLVEPRSGRNATRGGSSDTEVNDPTAIPTGPLSSCVAVTTTTPVGKCPRTWRKRPGSISRPHQQTAPPSTIRFVPVQYDAASLSRKTTGPTSSSVSARRPSGMSFA